jgi:hypothetical protein
MRHFLLFLGFCSALTAGEQSNEAAGGSLKDGQPVTNTDARKSIDGFAAALLITSDRDWKQKWDAAQSTVPAFTEVSRVAIGQKATILIFFSPPMVDANGEANVTCDITLQRPNGSVTKDEGMEAFKGKLPGHPASTFLAKPVIEFSGDPGDPLGDWIIEVTVHDLNRKVAIPLTTKFQLEAKHSG